MNGRLSNTRTMLVLQALEMGDRLARSTTTEDRIEVKLTKHRRQR